MRVVTWNVNSLRARQERVEEWVAEVQPDVLLLQETKLADDAFPLLAFSALGYDSAHYGQGQWNGVAILSKVGIDDVVTNFAGDVEPDPDARIITATCGGVRVSSVYVPNGRSLDDDHYTYKLSWLDRLVAHLDADTDPSHDVIIGGDYNIAPDDRDVHDPAVWNDASILTSTAERAALARLLALGLHDGYRLHHDEGGVFSWWDYRAAGFRRNLGLRIDLVLLSQALAERCSEAGIDREPRGWERPSDHAPATVTLD